MVSGLISEKDFESYVPVLDPRRLGKPAVIKGRNFIFDVDGPRSAWASKFANWWEFDPRTRLGVREFRVEGEFFYGTPTGIWKIDPISLAPELLLPIDTIQKYWPWTYAKVGNQYYFAQHDIGLWQYNAVTKIWKEVPNPYNAPVRGVCLAYGRLMCLSDVVVFWSALDNGENLTASTVTGAGFQPLSILSTKAFRVDPVTSGVIISTDIGWIFGEFVAASYVFRWRVLSRAVFTFSPNMATIIPDIGLVILDQSGFHLSNGNVPEVWEPKHGEYLKKKYLDRMDRTRQGCAQVYYSQSAQQLFVSIAMNLREGVFTDTTVYNLASGKWGTLDWPHHGIFEVTKMPYGIDVPAYMDIFGFMHHFGTRRNSKEVLPSSGNTLLDFVWRQYQEPAWRIVTDPNGVKVFTAITEIHLETGNPGIWTDFDSGIVDFEIDELEDCDEANESIVAEDQDPNWRGI